MPRHALVTALLVTTLVAPVAHAADPVAAEALFREGRKLMDAGNYREACPKLAESHAQDPATGTLLALAMCQEASGQTASAWATFAEVAGRAKREGRADREQAARERIAALDPKLSRLTIKVEAEVIGLVVKRDGKDVGKGGWGMAVPVDPGEHVLEATAPGKQPWRAEVTIRSDGDTQTVTIPALQDDTALAPGATEGQRDATASSQVDTGSPGEGLTTLQTVGLIVGGAGVVGLGVSGIFALRATGLNDDSKQNGCNERNECDPIGGATRDDAKSAANVATVAVIGGAVLLATGATLFIVGGRGSKETTALRVAAAPAIGVREAAITLRGSF